MCYTRIDARYKRMAVLCMQLYIPSVGWFSYLIHAGSGYVTKLPWFLRTIQACQTQHPVMHCLVSAGNNWKKITSCFSSSFFISHEIIGNYVGAKAEIGQQGIS